MLPVVIDEFKQNGSTDESIQTMMHFAISHRPNNGQVIYSISDDYDINKAGVKIVMLDGNHLMIDDDYKSAYEEVDYILNKNFKLRG